MTYTAKTYSGYVLGFFVVGGNADGTESGRIYAYLKYSGVDYLYDSAQSTSNFMKWVKSTWTSSTIIQYNGAGVQMDATDYGFTDRASLRTAGCDGSILFDGVKIL